jgi:hypothetical protein
MKLPREVIIAIAVVCACTLLVPAIPQLWMYWVAIAVGGLLFLTFKGLTSIKRRDPYSLESLRQMQEKEELDRLRGETPGGGGDSYLYCPNCGVEYNPDKERCRCRPC